MSVPSNALDVAPANTLVLQMARASRQSQLVYAMAKLGLADLLAMGPRDADDLAVATGTHAPSLRRLLQGLATFGVVAENEDGRFALAAAGECLRADVPESVRDSVLWLGGTDYGTWVGFLHSIRTGTSAHEFIHGMPVWTYHARNLEVGALLDRHMAAVTAQSAAAILASYSFAPFGTIVDVGGGNGSFLATILAAHPGVRGVLFDQPHVVAAADEVVAAAGVSDRCEVVGGDFFSDTVAGGDAYVFKQIIHDWDDAQATALLANWRRVMPPTARLLVIDRVLPERAIVSPAHQEAFVTDLHMLVVVGGAKERTAEAFRALFAAAGFTLTRIVHTASNMSIIEGVPA